MSKKLRDPLNEAYDDIPPLGLRLVAKVMALGNAQGRGTQWKEYPMSGDTSPLNHAIRHCFQATNHERANSDMAVLCAKAAVNLLMQIDLLLLNAESRIEAVNMLDDKIHYATKQQKQDPQKSDQSNG